MHSILSSVALTCLLGSLAQAAPTVQAKRDLSAPFYLQLASTDSSYDGTKLGTCHIGAAIEALCAYPNDTATFYINTTASQPLLPPNVTSYGDLIWDLENSSIGNYHQPMGLYPSISTNVAPAIFGLGDVQPVAFNKKGKMGLVSYYDDTSDPPTDSSNGTLLTKRWHVCPYFFEGYVYNTLHWEYGTSKPTNPSCAKVTVTQVFA